MNGLRQSRLPGDSAGHLSWDRVQHCAERDTPEKSPDYHPLSEGNFYLNFSEGGFEQQASVCVEANQIGRFIE